MSDILSVQIPAFEGVASVAALGLAAVAYHGLVRRKSRRTLPPGPKPLPVVGNWMNAPSKERWIVYQRWSEKYGSDVIYLKMFSTDVIVVNSLKAATELLSRNAAIYSDRPHMTMLNDIIGFSWYFGYMPYQDSWREHRRTLNQVYGSSQVDAYKTLNKKWTATLLQNLASDPDNLFEHIQHWASGISAEAAFGLQVQPSGTPDPFIDAAETAIEGLRLGGLHGAYAVDYLPILRYLPSWLPFIGRFQKDARQWQGAVNVAGTVPFSVVKQAMADGTAAPSITQSLLTAEQPVSDDVIRQTGSAIFANGSAAVVSFLGSFFLAMTLHPEVQAKAKAELDAVLQGRQPEYTDETSLPYLSALIKEVLRWNPVVPLAFPHRLTEDDVYHGYLLPAGSVVYFNSWAMLHDPATYPDPMAFKPERFLKADGQLDPEVKEPDMAFGFARRSCPGRKMALSSLWIAVASVLASYEIRKAKDSEGNEITPSVEYTPGLLSYPLPFKCLIERRE